jgi:hypothetical protein
VHAGAARGSPTGPPRDYSSSVYALSRRLRVGWRNLRRALASI